MLPVHLIADLFIAFFMFTGTQGAAVSRANPYAAAATSCRTGGATTYANATMARPLRPAKRCRTYKVGSATSTKRG